MLSLASKALGVEAAVGRMSCRLPPTPPQFSNLEVRNGSRQIVPYYFGVWSRHSLACYGPNEGLSLRKLQIKSKLSCRGTWSASLRRKCLVSTVRDFKVPTGSMQGLPVCNRGQLFSKHDFVMLRGFAPRTPKPSEGKPSAGKTYYGEIHNENTRGHAGRCDYPLSDVLRRLQGEQSGTHASSDLRPSRPRIARRFGVLVHGLSWQAASESQFQDCLGAAPDQNVAEGR
jgi:hypothetical protein